MWPVVSCIGRKLMTKCNANLKKFGNNHVCVLKGKGSKHVALPPTANENEC
jgi:hypothetical protein